MFDPDRQVAVIPVLTDSAERWNQHPFDEVSNRRLFSDNYPSKAAGGEFVAGDQRRVHLVGNSGEPWRSRWLRTGRSSFRVQEVDEVVSHDPVSAIYHVSCQLAGTHPSVDGLVMHADLFRDLIKIERVIGG